MGGGGRQGYTYIQEIVPGFAAHKQGQVQPEDVVIAVDNEPVEGWDLDAIKQLTIGEEHSFCTLLIKRGTQYLQVGGLLCAASGARAEARLRLSRSRSSILQRTSVGNERRASELSHRGFPRPHGCSPARQQRSQLEPGCSGGCIQILGSVCWALGCPLRTCHWDALVTAMLIGLEALCLGSARGPALPQTLTRELRGLCCDRPRWCGRGR